MANTFELIKGYTLLTDTSGGVTFSAIPQDYQHLLIKFSIKTSRASYSDDLKVIINSSSNYSNIRLYASNGSVGQDGGSGSSNNYLGFATATTADSSAFSSGQYLIANYANSSYPKVMTSYSSAIDNANNKYQNGFGNITNLADNAAVTSINVQAYNAGSGTLSAGSTIHLYGLSNS